MKYLELILFFGILTIIPTLLYSLEEEPSGGNDYLKISKFVSPSISSIRNIKFVNDSFSELVVPDIVTELTVICEASCPVEWKLDKFRFTSFPDELKDKLSFKTLRTVTDFWNISSYVYSATLLLTGSSNKLTGNYICSCANEVELQESIYIYWEGSSSSYLLQSGERQLVKKSPGTPWVTIFCGVSRPDVEIFLFKKKRAASDTSERIQTNSSVTKDLDGFHLNTEELPSPYGFYFCSLQSTLRKTNEAGSARAEISDETEEIKDLIQITELNNISTFSKQTVFFDSTTNTLICCSTQGIHDQVGFYCLTPLQCKFYQFRLTTGGHNAQVRNTTCSSYGIGKGVSTGAATFKCSDSNNALEVLGEQFFSLNGDTYFGLEEAVPETLIKVEFNKTTSDVYFFGEPLTYTCKRSSYPFSQGVIWMLVTKNGSEIILDKDEKKNKNYHVDAVSTNLDGKDEWIKVRIFNTDAHNIVCLAPLWNSAKWWRSSCMLNLSDSTLPIFVGPSNVEVILDSGETSFSLECKVHSKSTPSIKWFRENKEIRVNNSTMKETHSSSDKHNVKSKLTISDVDMVKELGSYVCHAYNALGENTQTFLVRTKASSPGLIIAAITVGFVILFALVMAVLVRKIILQKRALRHLTQAEIEEFEKGMPEALEKWTGDVNGCSHLLPYNSDYEIPRMQLVVDTSNILGQGTYGMVLRGVLKRGNQEIVVAVKTIKPNEDVINFKILLGELKIMAYIGSNANIVSLVGACSRSIRDRELLVAIEFCENGNLQSHLKTYRGLHRNLWKNRKSSHTRETAIEVTPLNADYANQPAAPNVELNSKHLVLWATQIASGMEFLSTRKVIHADLAARNILLTSDRTAKIGDFGLSKHLFEYSTYVKKTMVLLPWKWMAIESLQCMEFSVSSDVWAFGVTLWEIFTLAQVPYPGTSWNEEFIEALLGHLRLPKPQHSTDAIYEVMLTCWYEEPENRPSFTALKEIFTKFLTEFEK